MLILSFFNNRQTGIGFRRNLISTRQLNFDNILTKLVCWQKDAYCSHGQYTESPPFACGFRKDKEFDILAVATEDGNILLYDTDYKGYLTSFMAHHNAIFDICWSPDQHHLVTAAGDHRSYLFNMDCFRLVSSFKGHNASVKSVHVCPSQSALIATGSKDGNICVWDRREKSGSNRLCDKPSILIEPNHIRKSKNAKRNSLSSLPTMSSVSSVVFQDEVNLLSAGVSDGTVKVWDLRRTYVSGRTHSPRHQLRYSEDTHGITSMTFDSTHKRLFACCTSKQVFQFDCHSYKSEAVATYSGFKCNTYYIKVGLSCDDQYLVCGSSSHKAYIWKTSTPGLPMLELPGHTAEVTAVAWSPYNPTKLVTCADDNRVLVWKTRDPDEVESGQDNRIYSAAAPHTLEASISEDSFDRSTSRPSSVSPPFAPRPKLTSPAVKSSTPAKPPALKSITSFFSPLPSTSSKTPPRSPCKILSGNEVATAEASTPVHPPLTSPAVKSSTPAKPPALKSIASFFSPLPSASSKTPPEVKTSTTPPRSPCKVLSDNEVATAEASTPVQHPPSKPPGKENAVEAKKRKLSDSSLKHHARGKSAKKTSADRHSIKSYFTVSSSPE